MNSQSERNIAKDSKRLTEKERNRKKGSNRYTEIERNRKKRQQDIERQKDTQQE